MKKNKTTDLRKYAEERLKKRFDQLNVLYDWDPQRLSHELHVHQVELEMQNEELRKSHAELEESRARYSDLYDFAPVGYFTFDKNGLIIEVNLTGAGMLGVERNLLIKKRFSGFIRKDDQDVFFLHRNKVFETKTLQACELRLKRKNGEGFFAQLQSRTVEDNNGNAVYCMTAVSDISERKQAEQALVKFNETLEQSFAERTKELSESEERYRGIFEGSNDGIIACDLTTGKFLFINMRMSKLTGYSQEEISKLGVKDIHPPQDLPYVLKEFNKMASGEKTYTSSIPVLRKDGSIIYCDIGSSSLGKTILLGFFRDVTERKQVEEALRKAHNELQSANAALRDSQRAALNIMEDALAARRRADEVAADLAAANKELDAFSYAVSNDLRAPLRSIEGFTAAIIEDYAASLDQTAKDYFSRVISASHRMSQLIDAMLNMARLTRGELMERTVNLSDLAEVAVYELGKKYLERRVELVIANGVKAKGDIEMLRVVIENLMDNAFKFTGKNPSAKIEFGVMKEDHPFNSPPKSGGEQVYFVRDDGAGFDMDYTGKLFEPFMRLHPESKFPGIGIGLATVHKIINKHGGRIWAESQIGKGATFYFTLGSKINHPLIPSLTKEGS